MPHPIPAHGDKGGEGRCPRSHGNRIKSGVSGAPSLSRLHRDKGGKARSSTRPVSLFPGHRLADAAVRKYDFPGWSSSLVPVLRIRYIAGGQGFVDNCHENALVPGVLAASGTATLQAGATPRSCVPAKRTTLRRPVRDLAGQRGRRLLRCRRCLRLRR